MLLRSKGGGDTVGWRAISVRPYLGSGDTVRGRVHTPAQNAERLCLSVDFEGGACDEVPLAQLQAARHRVGLLHRVLAVVSAALDAHRV
jgi:hypothetical protein